MGALTIWHWLVTVGIFLLVLIYVGELLNGFA